MLYRLLKTSFKKLSWKSYRKSIFLNDKFSIENKIKFLWEHFMRKFVGFEIFAIWCVSIMETLKSFWIVSLPKSMKFNLTTWRLQISNHAWMIKSFSRRIFIIIFTANVMKLFLGRDTFTSRFPENQNPWSITMKKIVQNLNYFREFCDSAQHELKTTSLKLNLR